MDILAKCLLQARGKNRAAEGLSKLTVDSPIPYTLSDLTNAITHEMGLLNKATDTAPYMRLKTKIDELKSDPRYQFMFSGMLVADSMGSFIAKIFRLPAKGKPISIIDVSGVPSDIVSVVVAVLSRLVFDYAIWSRSEAQRPVLLVCEEAHRYIPSDKNSAGQAVRKILERIAKEGRKYGVSLGLITQRPSDLAEGVLSQCGTIIAMRLNNDRDQAFVKSAMPEGSRGFLDVIPALRNRECIVCGEGVSIPIRVSFDDLERDRCPASSDPLFSQALAPDRRGGGDGLAGRQALARAGALAPLKSQRRGSAPDRSRAPRRPRSEIASPPAGGARRLSPAVETRRTGRHRCARLPAAQRPRPHRRPRPDRAARRPAPSRRQRHRASACRPCPSGRRRRS